ncbi:MAG: hypothetical protein FRX49_04054 [Trebouxia sp. A1-2]|nr:MAG: hypothetical protein FRX49_04054 [Trebouxia sp. A1-2]
MAGQGRAGQGKARQGRAKQGGLIVSSEWYCQQERLARGGSPGRGGVHSYLDTTDLFWQCAYGLSLVRYCQHREGPGYPIIPVPTDVTWTPRIWGRTPLRTHRDRYTPTICLAATYNSSAMHISSFQHPVVLRMLAGAGKSELFTEHNERWLRQRLCMATGHLLSMQSVEAKAAEGQRGEGRAGQGRAGQSRAGEGRGGVAKRSSETDAYSWQVSSEYLTGLFSALSMCMSQTDPASRPPPTQKGRNQ